MAFVMSARMESICTVVAGADDAPITFARTVPNPTVAYALVPRPSFSDSSSTRFTSNGPRPSGPIVTVVTPCINDDALRRRSAFRRGSPSYACVCGSMNPGDTISPVASIRRIAVVPGGIAPTNAMRSPRIPTLVMRPGAPVPS